jgi:hypothetical protein
MSEEDDTMTDLTLNEYKGLSEKERARVLKEEARKICGVDSPRNDPRRTIDDFYPFGRQKRSKSQISLCGSNRKAKFWIAADEAAPS